MEPPNDILEAFLERGRRDGEVRLSATRLALALFAVVWELLLLFSGAPGTPATPIRLSIYAIGIVGSIWILAHLARNASCSMRAMGPLATAFDVLLALGATLPGTLWPDLDYHGYFSSLSNSILFLAIIAGGMRMSNVAARLGVALAILSFVLVTAVDQALWGYPAAFPYSFFAGVTVLAGSCMLSLFMAGRTGRLLRDGVAHLTAARRDRMLAEDTLGAYVSPEIARKALDGDAPVPGGLRRPVAVMFSDLRGFTAYGEELAPEQLIAELNDYLVAMVPAITAEQGMIDKFMGDGIMIVFGATRTEHDDARRAIRTAAAMGAALERHNEARAARGLRPLTHGIGIHWGMAIVGNVGTAARMNHTVIGDVVNTASRLQVETKRLGVSVLVSGAAVGAARAASPDDVAPLPALHPQGLLRLRGRNEELEVFAVVDGEESRVALAARAAATRPEPRAVTVDETRGRTTPAPGSERMLVIDLTERSGHGSVD